MMRRPSLVRLRKLTHEDAALRIEFVEQRLSLFQIGSYRNPHSVRHSGARGMFGLMLKIK